MTSLVACHQSRSILSPLGMTSCRFNIVASHSQPRFSAICMTEIPAATMASPNFAYSVVVAVSDLPRSRVSDATMRETVGPSRRRAVPRYRSIAVT